LCCVLASQLCLSPLGVNILEAHALICLLLLAATGLIGVISRRTNVHLPFGACSRSVEIAKGRVMHFAERFIGEAHLYDQRGFTAHDVVLYPVGGQSHSGLVSAGWG